MAASIFGWEEVPSAAPTFSFSGPNYVEEQGRNKGTFTGGTLGGILLLNRSHSGAICALHHELNQSLRN